MTHSHHDTDETDEPPAPTADGGIEPDIRRSNPRGEAGDAAAPETNDDARSVRPDGDGADLGRVPESLRRRDQWLLWDAANDAPRRPHWRGDFRISWSDPDEWRRFEAARDAAAERESWGVGYVTAAENDDHVPGCYGVIDLDGCLNADDDGRLAEWVPDLTPFIEREAYVERSPSGGGLHIPVALGNVPEWWTDTHVSAAAHEGVEVLANKFCTFTGDVVEGAGDEIVQMDEWLAEWLADAYERINGEDPRVEDGAAGDTESRERAESGASGDESEPPALPDWGSAFDEFDVDLGVYDIISPVDGQVEHPFHGSGTGRNFEVDAGGETWRCWRHNTTGNAVHLLGIEQEIIECGEWDDRDIPTETWKAILDAGREADYDIPDPEPQGVPLPDGDGGITWDHVRTMFADNDTPRGRALQATVGLLCERETFATMSDSEEVYRYNPETGIYEPDGEQHVGSMLEAGLGEHYSSGARNEVLTRIRDRTWTDRETFGGSRDDPEVCVGNGVLDIETLELYDHSPDREFIRRIPWDWPAEDDIEPEAFDAFLGDVVGDEESTQTVYEVLGLAIHPGYLKAGFLLLYGDGRNGKSTLLEALERVIHPDNVSSRSIQAIASEDHAAADLYGKMANICGDLPNDRLPDTGMLKQLTGGDPVTANPKYVEPFSFHNEAVLMFSANDPPEIDDDSTALARRLLLVNCPNEFTPEGEPGPDLRPKQELLAEITSPAECQAILRSAVEAVRRIRETGAFANTDTVEEVRERYKRVSDPVYAFCEVAIEETSEGFVTTSDLYDAYKTWCEANAAPVKDKGVFVKNLQKHVRMDKQRRRRDGGRVNGYAGISLTGDGAALLADDDPDAASLDAW